MYSDTSREPYLSSAIFLYAMLDTSRAQAQHLILEVQCLRSNSPISTILDVARSIHNIQIDTISVVSRSHNLICFNRFPKYQEGDVWKQEKEGKLFEYWSHSMCLMPMDAFPYYAWKMEMMRKRKSGWYVKWGIENKEIVNAVFQKVKEDGATKSKDLGESNTQSGGWWDWKKEKRALEYLMTIGRLMVSYREGFQKYYDIPERVVPSGIDVTPMSEADIPRYLIDTTLKSLGIADYRDIKLYTGGMAAMHFWKNQRGAIEEYLDSLVGDLIEELDFGQKNRYFVHKNYLSHLEKDSPVDEQEPVKILTPFDNILRERHYPKSIWDFDYKIECYVPKPDRKHGYFVLPILDQNELRGRVDVKVHRKEHILELISLYLEAPEILSEEGIIRLRDGIWAFAQFHNCLAIKCGKVSPRTATKAVRDTIESFNG